jgi:hypothetical protein
VIPLTASSENKSSSGRNDENREEPLVPETSFGSESVPEGQRPVNEYLQMVRQPMFDWADRESGNVGLLSRLVLLYVAVFALVCYPIAGATFTEDGYLLQKITSANVGALLLIVFVLLRLYSGWAYIGSRLTSKHIEYEETGWYDGYFQLKTENEKRRDKFLYDSKVKPVIDRVKSFTVIAGVLWLGSVFLFNVALAQNPIFDEYDPGLLNQLQYDDKLAEQAAANSPNQPTYCNNRYYRAIANGGQGCK